MLAANGVPHQLGKVSGTGREIEHHDVGRLFGDFLGQRREIRGLDRVQGGPVESLVAARTEQARFDGSRLQNRLDARHHGSAESQVFQSFDVERHGLPLSPRRTAREAEQGP